MYPIPCVRCEFRTHAALVGFLRLSVVLVWKINNSFMLFCFYLLESEVEYLSSFCTVTLFYLTIRIATSFRLSSLRMLLPCILIQLRFWRYSLATFISVLWLDMKMCWIFCTLIYRFMSTHSKDLISYACPGCCAVTWSVTTQNTYLVSSA